MTKKIQFALSHPNLSKFRQENLRFYHHARRQHRAGVSPSPVLSDEAVQSHYRKHECRKTRPAQLVCHAHPPAGLCSFGLILGHFSRTSKSAWLTRSYPAQGEARAPQGDRRCLLQDIGIISENRVALTHKSSADENGVASTGKCAIAAHLAPLKIGHC